MASIFSNVTPVRLRPGRSHFRRHCPDRRRSDRDQYLIVQAAAESYTLCTMTSNVQRAAHIGWPGKVLGCFCGLLFASAFMLAQSVHWEWRHSKYLEQTLRQAKIASTERTAIANAIAKQVGPYTPDMKFLGIDSPQQLTNTVLDSRVEFTDLDGDGIPEVIVQGASQLECSPTGNCPFWVFQKTGSQYRLLVSVNAIQTFQVQRSRSGGFRDIVVEMHDSATERTLAILKYSHGNYHEAGCYDANWTVVQGETVRELKEPLLAPCK